MQWGSEIKTLLEMQEAGIPVRALEERPTLTGWLFHVYQVFEELSSTRPVLQGGGPRSILPSEYLAYCRVNGFSRGDELWYWDWVVLFDRIWLRLYSEKFAKEHATPPATPR